MHWTAFSLCDYYLWRQLGNYYQPNLPHTWRAPLRGRPARPKEKRFRYAKFLARKLFKTFVADPDFYPSRISDPRSTTAQKEEAENFLFVLPFLLDTNIIKF
jgi:hypothetical protein